MGVSLSPNIEIKGALSQYKEIKTAMKGCVLEQL